MSNGAIVHVIDDDKSLREALRSLFASVNIETRLYESAQYFINEPRTDVPGCLVVDVRLPGLSGLDLQSKLVELSIDLPVILMTGYGDISMSVQAMKAGAVDFLQKPFRDQDMLDAVAAAIERSISLSILQRDAADLRARFAKLSPREQQVMKLVTDGKMNKQVAGDLGLSEITVKIHRGTAMRKMGARTLADLVRMAEMLKG